MALLLFVTAIKAQQPKLMLPIGNTYPVNSTSYSPDGKYIVTGSMDGINDRTTRENRNNFSRNATEICLCMYDLVWPQP